MPVTVTTVGTDCKISRCFNQLTSFREARWWLAPLTACRTRNFRWSFSAILNATRAGLEKALVFSGLSRLQPTVLGTPHSKRRLAGLQSVLLSPQRRQICRPGTPPSFRLASLRPEAGWIERARFGVGAG